MVRINPKYTMDLFLKSMQELAQFSTGAVQLVDEKAALNKEANKAVDTVRAKAAKTVAIGVLAGSGRKMIIAAAQDMLPPTGGRAARISDALAVLNNVEHDEDELTDIAEHWAVGDFTGEYAIRPLVMALRAPADIRPRIVGLFLTAWKLGQTDRIEDAVTVGLKALEQVATFAAAAEGTPEEKADAAVKEAKKWAALQFKAPEAEQGEDAEQHEAQHAVA